MRRADGARTCTDVLRVGGLSDPSLMPLPRLPPHVPPPGPGLTFSNAMRIPQIKGQTGVDVELTGRHELVLVRAGQKLHSSRGAVDQGSSGQWG